MTSWAANASIIASPLARPPMPSRLGSVLSSASSSTLSVVRCMALPLTRFRNESNLFADKIIVRYSNTLSCRCQRETKQELASIMAEQQTIPKQSHEQAWPAEGLTRVPYRVFQTEEFYRTEQQHIFRGPNWHYLA